MIWIIATNFENQWKSFGINLGLSEDVLDEMEARYDNKTFKVYDTLQKYVKLYPNTSLGFVANVLKENKQLNVAQKLIQNKVKY